MMIPLKDQIKNSSKMLDCGIVKIPSKALSIVAGQPSSGKTTVMLNMCLNLAKNGETCVFISYKESRADLILRCLSILGFQENGGNPFKWKKLASKILEGMLDGKKLIIEEFVPYGDVFRKMEFSKNDTKVYGMDYKRDTVVFLDSGDCIELRWATGELLPLQRRLKSLLLMIKEEKYTTVVSFPMLTADMRSDASFLIELKESIENDCVLSLGILKNSYGMEDPDIDFVFHRSVGGLSLVDRKKVPWGETELLGETR